MIENIKKPIYSYLSLCVLSVLSVISFAPYSILGFILLMILNLYYVLDRKIESYKYPKLSLYLIALLYFIAQVSWTFTSLYSIIDTGLVIALISSCLFAMILSVFFFVACFVFSRYKLYNKYLDFIIWLPALITLAEYIRGRIFTGFPWGDYSYTLVNNPLAKGLFPLLGSYGVSFIMLSIVGVFYCLITTSSKFVKMRLLSMMLLVCILLSYLSTIVYVDKFGKMINISLIQGNFTGQEKWSSQDIYNNLEIYKQLVENSNGEIIILPETAIVLFHNDLPSGYWDSLVKIAQNKNATLIAGIPKIIDENGNYANVAMIVNESQDKYYAKQHLVPYGEYIPFKLLLAPLYKTFNLPLVGFVVDKTHSSNLITQNASIAVNICYENGFNSELIKNASDSTFMLNISDMVWYGNSIAKDLHLELSQARAIENQRQIIQDTNTGSTAIIDIDGHVLSAMPSFYRGVLEVKVQGYVGNTPFQKYGNKVIVLFLLLIIICCIIYWRFRKSTCYGQI